MADPKISVMNLLSTKWVAANVSSITPVFSTGWYDAKSVRPQVTLTNPTENPQSTGEVPFFGIVTNGAPVQYLMGTLALNVWVTREAVAINPKQAVFEIREEIKRILKAEYDSIADLDFVGWNGGIEDVDPDQVPPVFRFIGEVSYGFLDD